MANITSLYLCNRTVYAAVGRPGAKGAKISAVCRADLPEGCLINGVITNETALSDGLKEFFKTNALPTARVALVLNGSQFAHQVLNLPMLPDKKLYPILDRELNSAGAGAGEAGEHLVDYLPLAQDKKARTQTLLGTRVASSLVESYLTLARDCGLKITSIDIALAAQIKTVALVPELQDKTFVTMQFDGENLYAALYVAGQYKYSTRSRLFNPRGTAESGAEITQKLSGILQFHAANKGESPITNVYFCGADAQDHLACRPGCETLQLLLDTFPDCDKIKLPDGCRLADVLFTAGNLIGR